MAKASGPATPQLPGGQRRRFTKIIELRPSASPVSVQFIVLERGEPTTVRKQQGGHIKDVPSCFALVADHTAAVKFQAMGQDEVDALQPSEIFTLTGGLFMIEKGAALLRCGRLGMLERIGTFDMILTEEPNMSNLQWTLNPETNIYSSNLPSNIRPWQPPPSRH